MPNRFQRNSSTPPVAAEVKANALPSFISSDAGRFDRLRDLFDRSSRAARVGIWECSLPDETLTWTDAVYELFELDPQLPLTRDETVALYLPESRRKLTELRSAAIESGEGFTLDAEIVTAKGNVRWIRITAIVERHNGKPVRLFGMKQDRTAEKLEFDYIRHLVNTDAVSGLASRTKFEATLGEFVAAGSSQQMALLLIDLDGFKSINDRLGHQAGDACLYEAGRRISQAVPDAALVARLGGDEFAIIHDCASLQSLEEIGKRVAGKLEWWVGPLPNKLKMSASVGATMISPGLLAKDVFAEADKALYAVKANGKNSFGLLPASDPIADVA